jgi:BMFP domain-containing protein YqiC
LSLSNDEISEYALSLLRVVKIGINVLARTEEENSSVEARVETLED